MGNEALATKAAELFSFNGHYSVPGDNDADDLLNDAGCFLASAIALFHKELAVADSPEVRRIEPELSARLYGVYHLLQMVAGITEVASHRASQQAYKESVA